MNTEPGISTIAHAFNQGSDARLSGMPKETCPYRYSFSEHQEHTSWMDGWHQVDTEWGVDARWPVQRVPAVAQPA